MLGVATRRRRPRRCGGSAAPDPCCGSRSGMSCRCVWLTCCIISKTVLADFVSRLPVGSSARIKAGFIASARAIATRCCWPPDMLLARLFSHCVSPTCASRCAGPVAASSSFGKRLLDEQRHHDVLERRECRDQIVILEHEADAVAAELGDRGIVELAGFLPLDEQTAARRPIEQADDVEQGALARSRRPDQGHEFAALQRQIDIVQHLDLDRRADIVGLAHAFEAQDRRALSHGSPPPDRVWRP